MSLQMAYYCDKEGLSFDEIRSCPRINIKDYNKQKHKGKIFCPLGHKLIGKCGDKVVWHYSHDKNYDDECCRHMGDWHHWWQNRVYDDFLEIVIKGKESKKIHIADMINGDDVVIEFQKSVIPEKVITAREKFYDKMIWVFGNQQHDIEIVAKESKFVLIKVIRGSLYFTIAKKQAFLDFGKRHLLEVLEVDKKLKSDVKIYCQIWTLEQFDKVFMKDCLKENYDDRFFCHGYDFEDDGRSFEECKKLLKY